MHKDHLGSVVLVTNASGMAQERYSYDAWGKRRNTDGSDYIANGGHLLGVTDRGYTSHEHLDHLGLVHMNGRIYDASAGRFVSADPYISQPWNLQNYNRYAYVNNNPLSSTDPTGYFSLRKFLRGSVFRAVVMIAVGYYTGGLVESWLINSGATGFATAAGLTGAGNVAVGAASGFASGLVGSGGELKSALHAGLSGGAFGLAGTVGNSTDASRYFAHAASGCLSSALGGGDCDQGATAALVGKFVTNNTPLSWGGPAGLVAASVAGGTVSIISGGKFANGAVTAAFGYLYNQALSNFEAARSAGELLELEYPMEVAMATDPSKMGLGGAGGPGARLGGTNFVVTPGGTAYPVPSGAKGPVPVINQSGQVTGSAFVGGRGGANSQVDTLRMMNPTPARGNSPAYPNGYMKYENNAQPRAQGVDPYSGKTLPNSKLHFPID